MSASTTDPGQSLLHALRDPARLAVLRCVGVLDAGSARTLDRLTRVAARALAVETVRVSLVDDERERFCALTDAAGDAALTEAPLSHSICRHVVELSEPLVVEDTHASPLLADHSAVRELGVRGYLGVPIVAGEHVLGSFCAVTPAPRAWSGQDLAVMHELAAAASETLALCAARADALVAEALDRSVLASLASLGVIRLDRDLRVVFAEGGGLRAHGWSPEAMTGRSLASLLEPEVADALVPRCAAALAGERVAFETAVGEALWAVQATPLVDEDGGVRGVTLVTHDVTEPRAAEAAGRSAEALTATLFDVLEEGIMITDAENALVALNPSARRMLTAVDADPSAARWVMSVFDADGRPIPEQKRPTRVAQRTGVPQIGVSLAIDVPGVPRRWARTNAIPITAADGSVTGVVTSWSDVTALRDAHDRAAYEAEHDFLTGLPNRNHVIRELELALQRARTGGHDVGVLFIDLDRFKLVNDSLGHITGDELLRTVAARLSGALREREDTLGRIAGDEFVVVAPLADGAADARALAERLLAVLREPVLLGGGTEHVVNASIGIALAAGGVGDVQELLRCADTAMYCAKGDGGGVARVFETAMARGAVGRLALESALRHAIAHDELELHYQPIVRPGQGLPDALEALVRWRHPDRGLVPPGDFIPVAEQSGLIVELGEWVLAAACRQIVRWRAEHGSAVPPVHVNLAARQLADTTLPGHVAGLLAAHGLPAQALGIEVTESMLMDGTGRGIATLGALHDLGVTVSLDDFGTGYSSLSRLHELRLDTLKIDRSFVADEDGRQQKLLAAIVAMAHSLDLRVVAEGVETEEQLERLAAMGCDLVQGYLLARPAPAAQVGRLV